MRTINLLAATALMLWSAPAVAEDSQRIVVITDTQFGSRSNMENVVEGIGNVVGSDFSLLVVSGDVTDRGGSSEYSTWKTVAAPLGLDYAWASNPPLRWVNVSGGNHDSPGNLDTAFPTQRNRSIYPGVSGSSTGQYGTIRLGDVVIAWFDLPARASGQSTFLQQTALAAASDPTPWKIAHWHKPPASCASGHGSDSTSAGWIDDYLLPGGFRVGFFGHNHYFAATCPMVAVSAKTCESGQTYPLLENPEGFVSITSGVAGARTRSCSGCSSWIEQCVAQHGFIVADFTASAATFAYYSVDGSGSASNPSMDYEFAITMDGAETTTTTTTTAAISTTLSTTTMTLPPTGCPLVPKDTCRKPIEPFEASLLLKDHSDNTKDKLIWKWIKGEKTDYVDFGNPLATDDYTLCVYETVEDQPGVLLSATAPAGDQCAGLACWKALSNIGFMYKDRELTADRLDTILLKAGDDGKAKIIVKGKGANLGLPSPLDVELPVKVQLLSGNGECWEADYFSVGVKKNEADFFKAKSGYQN